MKKIGTIFNMKNIFAPWRMKYIQNANKKDECFICAAVGSKEDEKKLILLRGNYAIVIMNSFPYNPGHVMVCPSRHIKFPYEMSKDESLEVMAFISRMVKTIQEIYKPDGFNIGVNIGKTSGAGEEHLHFHVVPRWIGDTNFMPVFAETKVMPESLEESYRKIKEALNKEE